MLLKKKINQTLTLTLSAMTSLMNSRNFFSLVDNNRDTESLKYDDQQKLKHYFSQSSGVQDRRSSFVCLNKENVTYDLRNSKTKNNTLKPFPFLRLAENIKYIQATEKGNCSNI